jgi:hypothetical protein
MNRLVNSFDLPLKSELLASVVNDKFIVFRYWAESIAEGNYLEHASGFNSTTIYIRHASGLPTPVVIAGKAGINLQNDFAGPLKNISLSADEIDGEVFALDELSQGKIVRLEFVRKGRYCLRYEFMESDSKKSASVDLVVR